MNRVLSFQTARGFGESSEFVRKRMCFSFVFTVGFLCLLGGFMAGRFAADRVMDVRAEKLRIQLAGNGLDSTDYMRQSVLQQLQENSFVIDYITKNGSAEDIQRIKDVLVDLKFFDHIEGNQSCIVATLRGSEESDRYVILSGSGEGVALVVELAKALKTLVDNPDWQPKRSLKFMVSLESTRACRQFLTDHVRANAVGYLELNITSIGECGYFVATGSDIVQSTVLQAATGVTNINYKNNFGDSPLITESCEETVCSEPVSRLGLDIPNAVITFVNLDGSSYTKKHLEYANFYRQSLAKIIATSVWRLSRMTILDWNPRNFSNVLANGLENFNSTEHREHVRKIVAEVGRTLRMRTDLNVKIDRMDRTKPIEVRMANDLVMRLGRVLMCCDEDSRSRTDWIELQRLIKDSKSTNETLRELLSCYETANEILQEEIR